MCKLLLVFLFIVIIIFIVFRSGLGEYLAYCMVRGQWGIHEKIKKNDKVDTGLSINNLSSDK